MAVSPTQDLVFLNALNRALRVLDDIAPARMEQAMIPSGRSMCQVTSLDQYDLQAAQRRVPRNAGSRCPAPDNQYFCFNSFHGRLSQELVHDGDE